MDDDDNYDEVEVEDDDAEGGYVADESLIEDSQGDLYATRDDYLHGETLGSISDYATGKTTGLEEE